jgi:hypothetical protein
VGGQRDEVTGAGVRSRTCTDGIDGTALGILNVIFGAGRELRRWRGSTEIQDVYDRIMALTGA